MRTHRPTRRRVLEFSAPNLIRFVFSSKSARLANLLKPSRWLLASVLVFLSLAPASGSLRPARTLTFEDRVKAQEAIERVYYSHQVGATESFEAAVPRELLERKVRTTLKESEALERLWNTPITSEALSREVDRMVKTTRMPERLREIFAALDNDPYRIQECLARPVLAERLIQSFYTNDERFHGSHHQEAEDLRDHLRRGDLDPHAEHPQRTLAEVRRLTPGDPLADEIGDPNPGGNPARRELATEEFDTMRRELERDKRGIGDVREETDRFIVPVLREAGSDRLLLAEYTIAKTPFESWWREVEKNLDGRIVETNAEAGAPEPSGAIGRTSESASLENVPAPSLDTSCLPEGTWDGVDLSGMPTPRYKHTAIWTGTVMIVWGGRHVTSFLSSGSRYDPATDSWSPTSLNGAPEPRSDHTSVWTGTEMLVWGGWHSFSSSGGALGTGGRYNPVTDTWAPISTTNTPSPRLAHTAVWTGTRMAVWGGTDVDAGSGTEFSTGAMYNPTADSWQAITNNGAPQGRHNHTAIWTGSAMIIWGGTGTGGDRGDGARFVPTNPPSSQWSPISNTGAPSPRSGHTAVWTGTRMVIWGAAVSTNTGAQYDPSTDSWSTTTATGAPSGSGQHTAVWSDGSMLVWGGGAGAGGRYNPATNTWAAISGTNAPVARSAHSAIWTGTRMVVWGGRQNGFNGQVLQTGGRYDPSIDLWVPTSTGNAPAARDRHAAVWTGSLMIVWGGIVSGAPPNSGGRYDPALNSWTPTSLVSAPQAGFSVWTGSHMVIWNGSFGGGRYDPIADIWAPISVVGAPNSAGPLVWTGNRVLAWGSPTNVGGRYDPVTDTWTPMSAVNAPSSRSGHTVVWTGSHMILWGGNFLNTGGRYDPVTDTWSPTTQTGAPAGRSNHQAVWTGSRMLIVSGDPASPCPPSFTGFIVGGSYDPVTDTWSTMSGSERRGASAVWTGSRMIVFGGYWQIRSVTGCLLQDEFTSNDADIYDPATDTWTVTLTENGPQSRKFHTAVWTGSSMLVWGGTHIHSTLSAVQVRNGGGLVFGQSTDNDGDGFTECTGDCNDGNPAVHPGAVEVCNGLDDDCNGTIDGAFDADGDGFACGSDCNDADPAIHPGAVETCNQIDDDCNGLVDDGLTDLDTDGYSVCTGDCNDANPSIHPFATELCNGIDEDCDGTVDDGFDVDADGFKTCTGDCNDHNASIHPGAAEVCNHVDEDCDGIVDNGFPNADGDGYAACAGDCNDSNASVFPGAPELCDHLDNNCNITVDEGFPNADGDGYAACAGDCNDNNATIHPGATEVCNGVDDNCNGVTDEGFDADGDGTSPCAGDCNDSNPAIHPGATETCNHLDDNCNGIVDDQFPDADGDGYASCAGDCNDFSASIHPGAAEICDGFDNNCNSVVDDRDADADGYLGCGGPDCNDASPAIHPGAQEICNGVDDNCNLVVDDSDLDGDGFSGCGVDCNDADPSAWDIPFEVTGFGPSGTSQSQWIWDSQSTLIGPGVGYDVASGPITPSRVELSAGMCLATVASPQYTDAQPNPALGWGTWFLVLAKNSCLVGSYGTDYQGSDRPVPPCP